MRQQLAAEEAEAVGAAAGVNPVAATIQSYRAKTRGWLDDGTVEWQAKRLHAESSFTPWERLSETDKEVWYYLARLELMGDPAAARERRARGV